MGKRDENGANGEAVELEDIDVTDGAPAGTVKQAKGVGNT